MTLWSAAWNRETGGQKAVMDDFEDGSLSEWDRVDTGWGISSAHAYEGSNGVYINNASGGSKALHSLEGSLGADFAPGQAFHIAFREVGGTETVDLYFAKQDDSFALNWYRVQLRILGGSGGIDISKDVSGSTTEFLDDANVSGLPSGSNWGHLYILWDTDAISSDPDNADGNPTGDFYVEIQDDNHVPKWTGYIDASDTTYRGGGVGFLAADGQEWAFDLLESGDLDAFANFTPSNHLPVANEIADFETADYRAWESTLGDNYQLVGSETVTPVQGDYCLMLPGGTGFREDQSRADGSASGQSKLLPAYLPDGDKAHFHVRTDDATTDELYLGFALGDLNNYCRAEFDWGDRFRILQFDGGASSVPFEDSSFSGTANQWYELVVDRTTTSQVGLTVNEIGGASDVVSGSFDPPSGLDGNAGVMIGGANSNGTTFYYDKFFKL